MEYKSYNTTLNNVNDYLDKNGVAVIPNILTPAECIEFRNRIWNELKYVTQDRFDINNQNTWREFYKFYPLHSMLLQHFSLGHMQPIWDIRCHRKVCSTFEKIWDTPKDDLLVSFDGLSVHLPPEKTNKGWFNTEWFHTDQSSKKINRHCIQGMINLYPVNEDDATLAVLEKSHLFHQSFFEDNNINNPSDWYKLKNDDEKQYFINKGCKQYAVKADIGSMTLWDSRTFHQGKECNRDRDNENFRMVIYICMLPRNLVTDPKILIKKRKAFENLRITSHWANQAFMFPKSPRTYGGELPEFNLIHQPELNDIGKRLAGY
jgi:hypothetical protein